MSDNQTSSVREHVEALLRRISNAKPPSFANSEAEAVRYRQRARSKRPAPPRNVQGE